MIVTADYEHVPALPQFTEKQRIVPDESGPETSAIVNANHASVRFERTAIKGRRPRDGKEAATVESGGPVIQENRQCSRGIIWHLHGPDISSSVLPHERGGHWVLGEGKRYSEDQEREPGTQEAGIPLWPQGRAI